MAKAVWVDVRKKNPGAFIAEDAQAPRCSASARIWERKSEKSPWMVQVAVSCVGVAPWRFERTYTRISDAVANYVKARDEATKRIEDQPDN